LSEQDARITYTLVGKFQDPSDGLFIQLLGEAGDAVVGVKASDFRNMREVQMASADQLKDLVNQASFSYHTVVVRAKVDDYMGGGGSDEVKFRYQAVRVLPMDFRDENEMLLKRLELYSRKEPSGGGIYDGGY
jgi:hypothetical protein